MQQKIKNPLPHPAPTLPYPSQATQSLSSPLLTQPTTHPLPSLPLSSLPLFCPFHFRLPKSPLAFSSVQHRRGTVDHPKSFYTSSDLCCLRRHIVTVLPQVSEDVLPLATMTLFLPPPPCLVPSLSGVSSRCSGHHRPRPREMETWGGACVNQPTIGFSKENQ